MPILRGHRSAAFLTTAALVVTAVYGCADKTETQTSPEGKSSSQVGSAAPAQAGSVETGKLQPASGSSSAETSSESARSVQSPIVSWKIIATPIKTTRVWTQAIAPRQDGTTDYIIQCWNYKFRTTDPKDIPEWLVVNLNTGQTNHFRLPGYANTNFGINNELRAPNGRIFFCCFGMHVYVYDPATRQIKLVSHDDATVHEGYKLLFSAVIGADGNFYGATQSDNGKVGLIAVDSQTLAARFYPDLANRTRPEGLTYGYFISADPPWVYVAEGKGDWTLVAVNVVTNERRVLAENASWVSFDEKPEAPIVTIQRLVQVGSDGKPTSVDIGANVTVAGDKQTARYWCIDGKLVPALSGASAPIESGNARNVRFASVKPIVPLGVHVGLQGPDNNGNCTATWDKEGQAAPSMVRFQTVTTEPIDLESMVELPGDGSLFGNAQQYRGFFRYHPDGTPQAQLEVFGPHAPSGPVYAWFDDKMYFSGYPSGTTFVYDPKLPWKTTNESVFPGPQTDNPRGLIYLGGELSGAHHAFFMVPTKDRIYFCGHRERGQTGTGLAWYEPKTQRTGAQNAGLTQLLPRGFLVMGALDSVVLSGTLENDPYIKGEKATQAELVVFDMNLAERRRIVVRPGLRNTGWLYQADAPDEIIGCISDDQTSALYRMGLRTDHVLKWVDLPTSDRITYIFRRSEDRSWWAVTSDNRLCQLDPVSLKLTPIGVLPGSLARPIWHGKSIFGTSGPNLVRVDGPFGEAK